MFTLSFAALRRHIVGSLLFIGLAWACRSSKPEHDAEQAEGAAVASERSLSPASSMASSSGAVPAAASSSAALPAASAPKPRNVLLITLDSLRADMPWTTYPKAIAPNLTELASQSVVYPNAYSVSSYTAKSVGALLSGKYPSSLYRSGWFFTGYSSSETFFTELLQQAHVRTLGIHAHLYFARGKQLDQGFDVWELVPGLTFDAQTDNHVTADKSTDLAIKLLSDPVNTGSTFFTWIHYMDPHDKYVLHEESPDFGKDNRGRYDSEVFFTDLHIGRLLAFAKSQAWWKNTAVIVSADHGEAFGEHGMYKHAFELWEVLTRVPLLVYAPGAAHKTITERRSHIDLAPTILELTGTAVPPGLEGRSLMPELLTPAPAERREPILLELPEDSHNPPRRAILSGDYKLIVWGKHQKDLLFNLAQDPAEEKDLAKAEPEKLASMKQLFDASWSKIPEVAPFGGMKLKSGKTANGPLKPPGH